MHLCFAGVTKDSWTLLAKRPVFPSPRVPQQKKKNRARRLNSTVSGRAADGRKANTIHHRNRRERGEGAVASP